MRLPFETKPLTAGFPMDRRAFIGGAFGLIQLMPSLGFSQQKPDTGTTFRMGFTSALFTDVNTTDALAATKVWASAIAKKRGFDVDPEPLIVEDAKSFADAFGSNLIDIAGVSVREYFEIKDKVGLTPHLPAKRRGKVVQDSVILAHADGGIRNIEDLREKDILLLGGIDVSIGKTWLETLVMEKGFSTVDKYFKSVKTVQKASQAVLPVYFKQATACMVSRISLETMVELNPQLKTQLKVLIASPSFTPMVVCSRVGNRSPYLGMAIDVLKELHKEPGGEQLMMLFKIDELAPFDSAFLDSARQVMILHAKLEEQMHRRASLY
jgi:ABC-type phosphate/phosphonate transport system substrate-binding protein